MTIVGRCRRELLPTLFIIRYRVVKNDSYLKDHDDPSVLREDIHRTPDVVFHCSRPEVGKHLTGDHPPRYWRVETMIIVRGKIQHARRLALEPLRTWKRKKGAKLQKKWGAEIWLQRRRIPSCLYGRVRRSWKPRGKQNTSPSVVEKYICFFFGRTETDSWLALGTNLPIIVGPWQVLRIPSCRCFSGKSRNCPRRCRAGGAAFRNFYMCGILERRLRPSPNERRLRPTPSSAGQPLHPLKGGRLIELIKLSCSWKGAGMLLCWSVWERRTPSARRSGNSSGAGGRSRRKPTLGRGSTRSRKE